MADEVMFVSVVVKVSQFSLVCAVLSFKLVYHRIRCVRDKIVKSIYCVFLVSVCLFAGGSMQFWC